MKIGIVTIYKCYNFGSFYQAYGLQKYLQDLGHEVSFIPIDSLYNLKYRLRKQFNRDLSRDIFSLKLIGGYVRDWKYLSIGSKNEKYDIVIIGSDEIWNIHNHSFLPVSQYYGIDVSCDNVFSYASCVGRSRYEDFAEYQDFIQGIENMQAVSSRDEATETFLKQVRKSTSIPRVLDPSFLIDWRTVEKETKKKNYILVYTYDGDWGFTPEYIKASQNFAKTVNLPLISVGFRNKWCDETIACGPREFLVYLRNATYVLMDTFHGTAMSIQYQKQFVCFGKGKQKVESLLSDVGLTNRIFTGDDSISDIVRDKIDYDAVDYVLEQKKKSSIEYLSNAMNTI